MSPGDHRGLGGEDLVPFPAGADRCGTRNRLAEVGAAIAAALAAGAWPRPASIGRVAVQAPPLGADDALRHAPAPARAVKQLDRAATRPAGLVVARGAS